MNLQKRVNDVFSDAFGRTPLKQRIDDILGEAIELSRYTDDRNLNEEAGDCLASLIALCAERNINYEQLVENTLQKIIRRKQQYKSLGRKNKIAILGGAFNPVTLGHIRLAQFVLNTSSTFDEVWLLPCYEHMYGKKLASDEHRIAMCELACKVDGRIKVCNYEIKNKLKGETYQTVKLLQEDAQYHDTCEFSWIIGQDNANTFHKWVNYEYLEKMIRFVIVPRVGIKEDPKITWYKKQPHIHLSGDDAQQIGEISSTDIRKLISDSSDEEQLLKYADKNVLNYIVKKKLYRN